MTTKTVKDTPKKMSNSELTDMLDMVGQILIRLEDAREALDNDLVVNPEEKKESENTTPVYFIDKTIMTEFKALGGKRQRVDRIVERYYDWSERYSDLLIFNHEHLWNKTLRSEMEEIYAVVSTIRPILKDANIL